MRDATKFGAHCAQGHVYDDMIFQDGAGSEDCLFLNVYAPADAKAKSKLPVMFWIHGGGYSGGAGSEPRHNGDFLPLKGVVLVTINYRLGVFGFLATADLAKEANGAAGNYGLLDMVAALAVGQGQHQEFRRRSGQRDHLRRERRLVRGQHADGSPMARGLFQRPSAKAARPSATAAADRCSCERAKRRRRVGGLAGRQVAGGTARAAHRTRFWMRPRRSRTGFPPVIDGKLLTEPVADTYAAGKQAHVPLLAGWNRDEGSFFAMRGMTAEQWKGMAAEHIQGARRGVPEALSRRHRRAGAALGHRLRQRQLHRLRHLEVDRGAPEDRRLARLSLPLRTGRHAQQVPSRHVRLPLRRHRVRLRHAGHAARLRRGGPRTAS